MLSKNSANFHIVFCGHVSPNFDLPDNFTFLEAPQSLAMSACTEKCYRYAYRNINAKYIMPIADDFVFKPGFLDKIIEEYNFYQNKTTRNVVIAPIMELELRDGSKLFHPRVATSHLGAGGPILAGCLFTTIKNSISIGGIDKRFYKVCWDMDFAYRHYIAGSKIYPVPNIDPCDSISSDNNLIVSERSNNTSAWLIGRNTDARTFRGTWSLTPNIEKLENSILCIGIENGRFIDQYWQIKRNSPVEEYSDKELLF